MGEYMDKRYFGEYALLIMCTAIIMIAKNGYVTIFLLWGVGLYSYWAGQRDIKRAIESGALSGDYQCTDRHKSWLDEKKKKSGM